MKNFCAILFIGSITMVSFCQGNVASNPIHKNSIQIEAAGHGFYASINYERVLTNSDKLIFSAQTGYAYQFGAYSHWFPTSANLILFPNNHHLEFGLGSIIQINATWSGTTVLSRELQFAPIARLGYRYQKPDGNFVFRFGFTPIFMENTVSELFMPWGGISFGYSF